MRKVLIVLLFTGSALAQAAAPSAAANPLNQTANAQKARTLLEQCIAAMGGQAWLTVKDMQQEGRTYSYNNGSPTGMGTLFWRSVKFPDKERTEFTKQRDVTYIYNGDVGYEITFKGTAAMDPVDLKPALFYDGPAIAEQKHTDSVTLLTATSYFVTLFLDEHSHLPVKKQFEY